MKILIYGDAAPASGGWCYAETLRDMGHEVLQVREDAGLDRYRSSLFHRVYRKFAGQPREQDRRRHVQHLMAEAGRFRPAILIVQKGLLLGHEDVCALSHGGSWICNINHDDFFSANRNNWSRLQRRAIPAYDFIFTTREVNVAEVRPLNPRVEFFPFAYYPRIHYPVSIPPDEQELWASDMVFVGTYEQSRAGLLEQLVRTQVKLVIHGAQWSKLSRSSPLRSCVKSTDLRFDDLAKAIGGGLVALGFLRKENRDDYTQRTFEIPACGGLLLAERTARHQNLYREGIEAEFFELESPEELAAKVNALLRDPVRREQMRAAGYAAVLRGRHTYRDRLERLLQVYEAALSVTQSSRP